MPVGSFCKVVEGARNVVEPVSRLVVDSQH